MSCSRAAIVIAVCSVAVLLAGCGGDDSSSSSGGDGGTDSSKVAAVDACEVLDKTEVAEVIGEEISEVKGDEASAGVGTCSWYGTDDGSLMQKGVTLIASPENGKEQWEAHKELYGSKAKSVAGIGDDAFTDGEVISAYEGDAYIVISPLYNDAGVTVEQVKPLGVKALEELG